MNIKNIKSISAVIPVYCSEGTLSDLHCRLSEVLGNICDNYEIIFVNDCSKDKSWEIIETLAAMDDRIIALNLNRNYGQHNALLCGIRHATSDIIVTLDDDLQNPPEEIPKLIHEIENGFDVVYGRPSIEQHGFLRDLSSQITKYVLKNAMGADTARMISAFRAFRTVLRDSFKDYKGSFVSVDVLLTWGTTKFTNVKVQHDTRKVGVSNYSLYKLFRHAANMITGFSVLPLQLASFIGFSFALFGFAILCYVIIQYLYQGTPVPGFPFLASVISIFSGAQLFSIGIIGEYLSRMHFRLMDRPSYSIRSCIQNVREKDVVPL